MKYLIAGVAIVAAIVALIVRPPDAAGGTATVIPTSHPSTRAHHRALVVPRIVVYVAGEVAHPGVYTFPSTARANDALILAGGAKSDADLVAVNLAAPLHDGDEVAVPKIGANAPRARRTSSPRARASHAPHVRSNRRDSIAIAPASIDLNAADESDLEALPGIGAALAARIVAYREMNGPFASLDELADVSGVTEHMIETIAPYLTVGS